VRREGKTVWVINPDYEPTPDVLRATVEVIGSLVDEGEPLDFPTALRQQQRKRMGLVQGGPGDV
jgi:hypothetical protein